MKCPDEIGNVRKPRVVGYFSNWARIFNKQPRGAAQS